MSDRKPTQTLVATAPDGTQVRVRTAAGYTWAGLVLSKDDTWTLVSKGWSPSSVTHGLGL